MLVTPVTSIGYWLGPIGLPFFWARNSCCMSWVVVFLLMWADVNTNLLAYFWTNVTNRKNKNHKRNKAQYKLIQQCCCCNVSNRWVLVFSFHPSDFGKLVQLQAPYAKLGISSAWHISIDEYTTHWFMLEKTLKWEYYSENMYMRYWLRSGVGPWDPSPSSEGSFVKSFGSGLLMFIHNGHQI